MKALGKLFFIGAIVGGGAYLYQYVSLITKLIYNVGNLKLNYFSLSQTELTADLSIENKGWFTAKIQNAEIDIYIEEKFVGKLIKNEPFTLLPASTTLVPVIVSINPSSLGGNLKDIFNSIDFSSSESNLSNLNIKFVGKLTTKVYGIPFNIPFTYSDKINNLK